MKWRRVLVVYYSRSGNTRKVAEELARRLNADIEEINSDVAFPMGFVGHQKAMIYATLGIKPGLYSQHKNLGHYDLVVIGGPVWSGTVSAPMRSYLEKYKNEFKNVAFFMTQSDPLRKRHIFEQMKKLSGKHPLAHLSVTESNIEHQTYKRKLTSFLSVLNHNRAKAVKSQTEGRPYLGLSPQI